MRVAALILGILAGLAGLIVAVFASAMISASGWVGSSSEGEQSLARTIFFALPIASFAAAGLSLNKTKTALGIFAITAMVWLIIGSRIGAPLNFVNAAPLLFSVAAAALCLVAEGTMPDISTPATSVLASEPPLRPAQSANDGLKNYDAAKWNALARYDDDVRRSVEKLAPYGQPWIDALAADYFTIGDKSYLPKIEERLIAEAEEHRIRSEKIAEEECARSEALLREAERIKAAKIVRAEERRQLAAARLAAAQLSVRSATRSSYELFVKFKIVFAVFGISALVMTATIFAHEWYVNYHKSRTTAPMTVPNAPPKGAPMPDRILKREEQNIDLTEPKKVISVPTKRDEDGIPPPPSYIPQPWQLRLPEPSTAIQQMPKSEPEQQAGLSLNLRDIQDYTFDLPKKYPSEWRSIRALMTQQMMSHGWLYNFRGVAAPMQELSYKEQTYYVGWICKPHDCLFNTFHFVVPMGGGRAVALLISEDILGSQNNYTARRFLGSPSAEEIGILIKLSEQ